MRNVVSTTEAPAAIGPYSQAIDIGSLCFLSGQISLDPVTGQLRGENAKEQTEQILRNIEAVLRKAELSFEHVVKTTIFLVDMNDFAAVNEIYASRFSGAPPARSTVAVHELPRGARVEIEVIAAR